MRLGSGEHYGWETPRTVSLMAVVDGDHGSGEFAWLRVPEGAKGGPLDVMVRPRVGEPLWRKPQPGRRVDVAAWVLDEEQLLELESGSTSWRPPKPAPDMWLWVSG